MLEPWIDCDCNCSRVAHNWIRVQCGVDPRIVCIVHVLGSTHTSGASRAEIKRLIDLTKIGLKAHKGMRSDGSIKKQ